jgi:hypothetical protein
MDRVGNILKVIGFVVLVSLVAVYAADYAWSEYRLGHASGADALGTLTFYYATMLKNGKLEIFYNQPQTEVCIYAIFPHAGYRPCWYAARNKVRTVS